MSGAKNGSGPSNNVIKIDDARELRELGLPILPVVDASFSKAAERFFHDADSFRLAFYTAFVDYSRAPTRKQFRQMTRALTRIDRILAKVETFASPDYGERVALRAWFSVYVAPFVKFWNEILASVESGGSATVTMTREAFDGWDLPTVQPTSPPTAG